MEIILSPPHLSFDTMTKEEQRNIRKKTEGGIINVQTLNIPGLDINIASVYPEMRAYTVKQYKQLIQLANEWGVPYILMHPGKLHPLLAPDFEWIWDKCKPCYEEIIRFAELNGVVVLLENMPTLLFQTADQIKRVLNEFKSDSFAAIYDVSNGFMVEDPAEGIRNLAGHIRMVHLNDTSRQKWDHNAVGENEIDFGSIFSALQEIDYSGDCMFEITSPRAEEGILKSLEHLRKTGWKFDF